MEAQRDLSVVVERVGLLERKHWGRGRSEVRSELRSLLFRFGAGRPLALTGYRRCGTPLVNVPGGESVLRQGGSARSRRRRDNQAHIPSLLRQD